MRMGFLLYYKGNTMKKVLLMVLLLLVMLPSMSYGKVTLDDAQMFVLDISRIEGNTIGWPETIQGIGWVESKLGKYIYGPPAKTLSDRYFGPYQIKISTARYIMEKINKVNISMTDQEIMTRLLVDYMWSAELATDYFGYLMNKFKDYPQPWRHAVLAYNRGPGTVKRRGLSHDPYGYVENVKKAIRTVVRPYNKMIQTAETERRTLRGIRLVGNTYTNLY
jgi:hypothetical protein